MKRKIIVSIAVLCMSLPLVAQSTLNEVLESVERNNLTLQALRHATEARSLEARTGNSLDDLTVSYDHLWGKPVTEFGKTAEFAVSQSFDFPTVYANRNKVARNLGEQYRNEFHAARQEILLDAKKTFFELQSAMQSQQLLDYREQAGRRLAMIYEERFAAGDASVLEKGKIRHEYLLAREAAAENRMKVIELEKRLAALNGGEQLQMVFAGEPLEELGDYARIAEDYKEMYPTLQALRLKETGSEYDIKLSRSQSLPKFELGYKHEYASAGDRFNGVTVGMSIPIFSNRNNVKRAKALQQATRLEMQAAEVEYLSSLSELYGKAEVLHATLDDYEEIGPQDDYLGMLDKALDAGELNVVDYFSEVYSYYDVFSARLRLELEYRLTVATINAIYL